MTSTVENVYPINRHKKCTIYTREYVRDEKGNPVYIEDREGDKVINKITKRYNENNNLIYRKVINDEGNVFEEWIEYDRNGYETHCRDTNGEDCYRVYDDNGNLMFVKKVIIK